MKLEHLTRQLDVIPVDKLGKKANIIGAGAIGSWTALALAKMGVANIEVWDFDMIDDENMNCQFYPPSEIGKPKVEALKRLVQYMTGVEIEVHNERFDGRRIQGILICAVDNMKTRKEVWKSQQGNYMCEFILDPRMAVETAALYIMQPNLEKDQKAYAATLYTDEQAVAERCTAKSTIYTANLLSGLVAKGVKDILVSQPYPRVTTWDIGTNQMITHMRGA